MYLVLDDKAFLLATPDRCRGGGPMFVYGVVVVCRISRLGMSIFSPQSKSHCSRCRDISWLLHKKTKQHIVKHGQLKEEMYA